MFNYNEKVIPAFEDVKFSDLFSGLKQWTWNREMKHEYPDIKRTNFNNSVKFASIQTWLNFSQRTGQEYQPSFDVIPSPLLVNWVDSNMLAIDYDKIYFEIITFDDYFDIYARYNQIIGSRLIARMPLTELLNTTQAEA